ncbi:hypothetical protein [Micromonospora sp. DPT]|uniref:hypothetical protein n=1 Tax=Micromonospora sp. DPT TaxID=3142975 RepID=UPI00320B0016
MKKVESVDASGRVEQSGSGAKLANTGIIKVVNVAFGPTTFIIAAVVVLAVLAWWATSRSGEGSAAGAGEPAFVGVGQVKGGDCDDPKSGWVTSDEGRMIRATPGIPYVPEGQVVGSGTPIGVTVQGSSRTAVIIQGARVEITSVAVPPSSGALLPAYCQGDPTLRNFAVDLDAAQPRVVAVEQDGRMAKSFPYQVTDETPEQWFIVASTKRAVEWRLVVEWTSAGRNGTTVIDNNGEPFRTVGTRQLRSYCSMPDGWKPPPC